MAVSTSSHSLLSIRRHTRDKVIYLSAAHEAVKVAASPLFA